MPYGRYKLYGTTYIDARWRSEPSHCEQLIINLKTGPMAQSCEHYFENFSEFQLSMMLHHCCIIDATYNVVKCMAVNNPISNGWAFTWLDGDGFLDELVDDWTELGFESGGFELPLNDSGQAWWVVTLSTWAGSAQLWWLLELVLGRFSNNSVSWNSIISFFVFSSSQFWIESDL